MGESLTPKQINRLREAAKENYLQAEDARESRSDDLKILAGTQYPGIEGDDLADYVNLMRDSAQAKTYSMAANRPRANVLTFDPSLKAWAKKVGRTVDAYSKRLRLEKTLSRWSFDAFFGLGIVKTAMIQQHQLGSNPYAKVGHPGIVDVSQDHFCWDMEATDFEYCSFLSDRYRCWTDDLLGRNDLPKSVRKAIEGRESEPVGNRGSEWGEAIGAKSFNESIRFEDWVYCADFFLPHYQCIYTFLVDSDWCILGDEPIGQGVTWEGKPTGPHSFLTFGRVPGKTIPSTPSSNLRKQHNLINTCYRKLEEQAESQKTVFLGMTGNEEDSKRIRDAFDQEIIPWANGQKLETQQFMGPDAQLFGFLQHLENRYSESSGNLRLKLGTAPSADTAKQEGMLGAAVSNVDAHDNAIFISAVREVMIELAGLLWRDKATHIPMMLNVPGTTISVMDDWLPVTFQGARRGVFEDYEIDIEPYSLAYKPPSARAEELRALWNEQVPLWEMMAQQGVTPDVADYLETQGRYRNLPELRDMLKFNRPPRPVGPADEKSASAPSKPGGPREYLHRSAGPQQGGSAPRGDQIMQAMQSGARNNQNQN